MKTKTKIKANEKPSLAAQFVSKTVWYYEDNSGLGFCVEIWDANGSYVRTEKFNVPLAMLRQSLKRLTPN